MADAAPIGVRLWWRLPAEERERLLELPWPEYQKAALKVYGMGVRKNKGPIFYIWPVIPVLFPQGQALILSHEDARADQPAGVVVFTIEELAKIDTTAFGAVYQIKARFGDSA